MALIKFEINTNATDWIKWLNNVPERTQIEVENTIPNISRRTKTVVKKNLRKGAGVDEGIYKRSFKINTFAENKWQVGFQVFAKKPHYRLTHLLEYGHRMKLFRWGKGTPTKWGNVGMSFVSTLKRPSGKTEAVPHIAPAQEYAIRKVNNLYYNTINKIMTERTRKL